MQLTININETSFDDAVSALKALYSIETTQEFLGVTGVADAIGSEEIPNMINANEIELDSEGYPWDSRIHSSNKSQTATGKWQKRRGVSDMEKGKIEKELAAAMGKTDLPTPDFNTENTELVEVAPDQFVTADSLNNEAVQAPTVPAPTSVITPPPAPIPAPAPAPVNADPKTYAELMMYLTSITANPANNYSMDDFKALLASQNKTPEMLEHAGSDWIVWAFKSIQHKLGA